MPLSVPVSVVMASAIALSAALAAIVAFVPTYTTGIDSTQATVDSLRENIIGRVENGVSNFFKGPEEAVSTIDLMAIGGVDFAVGSDADVVARLCDQIFAHSGVTQSTLYSASKIWFCAVSLGPVPIGSFYNGSHMLLQEYNHTTRNWNYRMNPETMTKEPIPWAVSGAIPTDLSALFDAFYNNSAYHQPGRHWSAAELGYDSAQYEAFSFLHSPSVPGQFIISLQVLTAEISIHLASVGLPRRARALAVDGTNGIVVGNSWGAPMKELYDFMNFTAPEHERIKLFTLSDINDTLVTRAVAHIGGQQAFLSDIKGNYSSTMGSGKDRVFVDVFRVAGAGLSLPILLAMPEIDFLEDTYASRDRTIGAVCGALGGLICLAIIFSILIARPLHRLGDRMYKTASLQDDDADDSPSILSEVRSMQEAYTTMKQELNRMKSYLPQSVLCAMYNNDDDDDQQENDEGDIEESMSKAGSSVVSSGGDTNSAARQQRSLSSTRSHSSMTSSMRESGQRAGASGFTTQLNLTKSVLSKRVVVVAFNLCGFQKRLEGNRGAKDLPEMQARFLTLVNKYVRENKGVVDTFQGDHILASFNAVSNVVSAPKRAALAALLACQEAAKDSELPPVSVGISAGAAFVGNMGNNEMQRFNIVGPVYVEALLTERLAREQLASATTNTPLPWRILGLGNLIPDIFQCVDFVAVPSNPRKPQIAIAIEQLKTVTSGEWMYMLEEGANVDPFTEINEAYFTMFQEQDVVGAKTKLEHMQHSDKLAGYDRLRDVVQHASLRETPTC